MSFINGRLCLWLACRAEALAVLHHSWRNPSEGPRPGLPAASKFVRGAELQRSREAQILKKGLASGEAQLGVQFLCTGFQPSTTLMPAEYLLSSFV